MWGGLRAGDRKLANHPRRGEGHHAITAVISAHRKLGDSLSELQLYVMAQRRKADKRVSAGGKTAKRESAACRLLLHNWLPTAPTWLVRSRLLSPWTDCQQGSLSAASVQRTTHTSHSVWARPPHIH
jgi:hypothetical protein